MAEHDLTSAVKLASNENPYDPLPSVREALTAALGGLPRYPDHRATAVRETLADRLGLTADRVTVGCGSVGILQQLLLTYVDPGQEVLYGWRSFEAYPIYTRTVGGAEVTVPNRREALDIAGMVAALSERTRLVMVTSPNNPTGTAVAHEDLVRLLDAVPPSCLVVLDEAYHEYVTGAHVHDAASLLDGYPNLAVLRTFSKAYGLAALRIGYLFGHPEVISAVDRTLVPFAVNGLAQVGALASLAADEEPWPSAPGCRPGCASEGSRPRMPRPISCGSRSGSRPPSSRWPSSVAAWSPGRSPGRESGSPSAPKPRTTGSSTRSTR
jgi:histidinol-phosphate aminotransferase